ncbi:MAG TPA: hypothetical protein VF532_13325 [Candidatus Angelobacter sp.]
MSFELETLDQLLGGELSLAVIRQVYPDEEAFRRGVHGLLTAVDVSLLTSDGTQMPAWRWRELFIEGAVMQRPDNFNLAISEAGAKKIR